MGDKAKAKDVDPHLPSTARAEPAAPENRDDAVIAQLSELIAYAPPQRARSSIAQPRSIADDQEDRMPLFLEREEPTAGDDEFHFKHQDPLVRDERGPNFPTTEMPARWLEPEEQDVSSDFAKPRVLRHVAWAAVGGIAIAGILGAAVFSDGSFSGWRPDGAGLKQVAQAATRPKQSAISFDQTFAAVSPPATPERKLAISDLSVSTRTAEASTVGIATHTPKLQTDKPEERTPSPPVAAADLPRRIDQAELANLLKRGRELIDVGDIASARLFLQRAADAREPQAAFALAGTYDPAVLSRVKAYGIAPDPAMARAWYEKAREFGSPDAQRRLDQLSK
jgi:hypothetical protein